jgi:hypothetical protein
MDLPAIVIFVIAVLIVGALAVAETCAKERGSERKVDDGDAE